MSAKGPSGTPFDMFERVKPMRVYWGNRVSETLGQNLSHRARSGDIDVHRFRSRGISRHVRKIAAPHGYGGKLNLPQSRIPRNFPGALVIAKEEDAIFFNWPA